MAGTVAAGAAAAVGGAPAWLFSYNKENFGYDAGMRFGRFMMARGFANTQVAQYREDVAGITGMTVTKMDAWQTVTTLFLAVGAALSCAGRIGMHGCAPPGWFCALFSGCIFASILFNGLALWLSMHASLRAQCAATSLLTRKVRLPIPSMAQLDQARVFGSSFEKQELRDIFRVPFCQHPEAAPDMPPASAGGGKGKKAGDPQDEFGSTSRNSVPSWIRDEVVVDKGEGFPREGYETAHEVGDAPDHFTLLMEAQKEWRDYDVYARISMLFGVVMFLYAVTYYAVGTAISELRGFWVMWSLPLVFVTAQALILRLDILQTSQHYVLPHAEWLGHFAPFLAVAACTLEYRFYYSEAQVAVTWALVFAAFFCHFVMALRMLDLAWPSASPTGEMPEEPGKQWWPASWKVPLAFTKNLWFITPPTKLEPGQNCLVHEMQDMALHGGGVGERRRGKALPKRSPQGKTGYSQDASPSNAYDGTSPFKDFGFKRASDLPWKLVRVAICTVAFQWFFMMIASSVEIVMGPESLLKPPGEPPWIRDTKARGWMPQMVHSSSHALPESYRLFSASTMHYGDEEGGATHSAGSHAAGAAHGAETSHGGDDAHEPGTSNGDAAAAGVNASHAAGASHSPDSSHGTDASHDSGESHDTMHSGHRRLAAQKANESSGSAVLAEVMKLMPDIRELADHMASAEVYTAAGDERREASEVAPANFLGAPLRVKEVAWPPLFEPRHLLCKPQDGGRMKTLALTSRGFGALVPHDLEDATSAAEAQPFALDGLMELGPIAGASWTQAGLSLLAKSGKLALCPGHAPSADGVWPCQATSHAPLPLPKGGELIAAGILGAKDSSGGPVIALVFEHMPEVAVLYHGHQHGWTPSGEVHMPKGITHLSFAGDDLLATTTTGEVHRRSLSGARPPLLAAAALASAPSERDVRAACSVAAGGPVMRLAVKATPKQGAVISRGPELILPQ